RHKSSNPFPLIIPKCVAIHRRSPKISVESDLLSSGNPRSLIRHYDLENQRRQLIERVGGLKSEQNKPCNHHIEAKMHEGLATNCLLWRVDRRLGCEPNSTRNGKHDHPENISPARRTESFRRRGRDAFVANLFGPLFDASFLPVHVP
ncbi:MAG: hypothetical protein KGL35_09295, partial [Bradyrhizobium sp.]|nr:hypothetical protein [Bradyrhizobium sp.]